MKSKMLRFLFALIGFLLLSSRSLAQSDATVVVPVTWLVEFLSMETTGGENVSAIEFSTQLTGYSQLWYEGSSIQTSPQTMQLEVGRRYELAMVGEGMSYYGEVPQGFGEPIPFQYTVFATSIPGYTVYVEGKSHGTSDTAWGVALVSIIVGPEGGCNDCGPGRNYSLLTDETRVEWSVEMGRSVNGRPLDPIRFAADSLTYSSFNRTELNFAPITMDVQRIPAQGPLQQVLLPGALLNAVDVSYGFELRFYLRSQMTGTMSGGLWQLQPGSTPYVTYRFKSEDGSNPTPAAASFTRIKGSIVELNSMERDPVTGR